MACIILYSSVVHLIAPDRLRGLTLWTYSNSLHAKELCTEMQRTNM